MIINKKAMLLVLSICLLMATTVRGSVTGCGDDFPTIPIYTDDC